MLSENWITEKTTDFEYKKYLALAYLQSVYSSYEKQELHPLFGDIAKQHETLLTLIENKLTISESMSQELVGIDWEKMELKYDQKHPFSLGEIEQIVDFAFPRFEKAVNDGEKLKEEILTSISVEPVGVIPVYQTEGFLIMEVPPMSNTTVYRYSSYSLTSNANYSYKYVGEFSLTISQTYYQIKSSLANTSDLPVPATYLISSKNYYPMEATFFPLAVEQFEDFHAQM